MKTETPLGFGDLSDGQTGSLLLELGLQDVFQIVVLGLSTSHPVKLADESSHEYPWRCGCHTRSPALTWAPGQHVAGRSHSACPMMVPMNIEAVSTETTRPVRRTWLVQRWTDLTFLHWAVDPAQVARLLPAGIKPDTLAGVSYVGLIGFKMENLGLLRGPGLPYLGTFCETNVRLYGVDADGRRSVVFRSLDAARLIPVLTARALLRLPYMWSKMRLKREGDVITYINRRRWPGPRGTRSRMTVRIGGAITESTEVEDFVTARWGLHTRAWGRTLHLPNDHPRWPLFRASLLHLDDELVAAAGLAHPAGPPASVLFSPGVPVTFGAPAVVAD